MNAIKSICQIFALLLLVQNSISQCHFTVLVSLCTSLGGKNNKKKTTQKSLFKPNQIIPKLSSSLCGSFLHGSHYFLLLSHAGAAYQLVYGAVIPEVPLHQGGGDLAREGRPLGAAGAISRHPLLHCSVTSEILSGKIIPRSRMNLQQPSPRYKGFNNIQMRANLGNYFSSCCSEVMAPLSIFYQPARSSDS